MRTRGARMVGANLAFVVVGASLALTTSVAPSSPAAAVAVTVGPIEAQMANHHGTTVDTSAFGGGNCIRYSPVLRHRHAVDLRRQSQRGVHGARQGRQLLSGHCRHQQPECDGIQAVIDHHGGGRHAVPDRADGPLQQPDPGVRPVLRGRPQRPPRRLRRGSRRSTSPGRSRRPRTTLPAPMTRSRSAARSRRSP